jgi:hypothetical protein
MIISPSRPSLALFRTLPTATLERNEPALCAVALVAPQPAVAIGCARDAAAAALLYYIIILPMQILHGFSNRMVVKQLHHSF